MASKRNAADLDAAINELAALFPFGAIQAASFPAAFLREVVAEVRRLRRLEPAPTTVGTATYTRKGRPQHSWANRQDAARTLYCRFCGLEEERGSDLGAGYAWSARYVRHAGTDAWVPAPHMPPCQRSTNPPSPQSVPTGLVCGHPFADGSFCNQSADDDHGHPAIPQGGDEKEGT